VSAQNGVGDVLKNTGCLILCGLFSSLPQRWPGMMNLFSGNWLLN
jgi:hypothetical protein